MSQAERLFRFFEGALRRPDGSPFILADWQKEHLRTLFGTVRPDGRRQFSETYWELPKKNGKSTLCAGIGLYGLLADNEDRPHIYLAASCREQAMNVFRPAAEMVTNSPVLAKLCRVIDSTKTIILEGRRDAFLKVVSADAGTQDGVEPHFVIFDELHRQRNWDLWSVLRKGQSTRRNPLMFAITTAGIRGETPICWEKREYARAVLSGAIQDPAFYPVIYGLEPEEDWADESNWLRVNPALGDPAVDPSKFKNLHFVRQDFLQARRSPASENEFRRFELNQWVEQETRWIPLEEWLECSAPFDPQSLIGCDCYAGLDLSTTVDISALVLAFRKDEQTFLLPYFWMPEKTLTKREAQDNVPYRRWAAQGLIHVTPGNGIDYGFIRNQMRELGKIYNILEVAHDPWNATQVAMELGNDDGFTMVPVRQGFASLSAPTKEFERMVLDRLIRHNNNPVLTWMLDCVTVASDPAGNIKPVKPDRLSTSKRIDGVVASIMAVDRLTRHTMPKPSVYETRGVLTV